MRLLDYKNKYELLAKIAEDTGMEYHPSTFSVFCHINDSYINLIYTQYKITYIASDGCKEYHSHEDISYFTYEEVIDMINRHRLEFKEIRMKKKMDRIGEDF